MILIALQSGYPIHFMCAYMLLLILYALIAFMHAYHIHSMSVCIYMYICFMLCVCFIYYIIGEKLFRAYVCMFKPCQIKIKLSYLIRLKVLRLRRLDLIKNASVGNNAQKNICYHIIGSKLDLYSFESSISCSITSSCTLPKMFL